MFPSDIFLFFECQSLADCTPAFVALNGIVTCQQSDLTYRGIFQRLLKQTMRRHDEQFQEFYLPKEEITKCYDAALKEEQIQYSKSTDGAWLKDREDYYKARIEIDYLYDRSQLMDTLVSWFGDIIRKKCNFAHLDYPQLKKITTHIAESQSTPSLIKRMNALELLRDALNTNADEKLALETGFMQTFG